MFRSKLSQAVLGLFLALISLLTCGAADPVTTNLTSQLLEVSGTVELSVPATNGWRLARANEILRPGDKLRTGADSRATVRLSDKSVIRIDQQTMVEITPPAQPVTRARFRISWGALFFLNREKPSDIEFETPLATGAIRGTEFLLSVNQVSTQTSLVLFDGAVDLHVRDETLSLVSGQQAVLRPNERPEVIAALSARNLLQWTLYYPGVLNPDEIVLPGNESGSLSGSLELYRKGDLLGALGQYPKDLSSASDPAKAYFAALKLSVGRVDETETLLTTLPVDYPPALALRELIVAVRFEVLSDSAGSDARRRTSSEWLAHSYYLQSRSQLSEALSAAREAVKMAPEFGFGWVRVAELEFASGNRRSARDALVQGRRLSPRNAQLFALEGFIALDEQDSRVALAAFNQALALDGALGNAWLGRGLANAQLRKFEEARRDLQAAAALEPTRSLYRSYLGKAFSQLHEDALARKDFRLAKQLDPGDPTPWLYSALHDFQLNRVNEAVSELEQSVELNDNRSVFRSGLLLDQDRAIRNADLAAIYDEAGMSEVGRLQASRSVSDDYANFSGHLFLARSLQSLEDPNTYNLRYETPRQSELLVANLLAPIGGGNLSQLLSLQDHLQYFDPRPIGGSSLTQYGSNGDWEESATLFGTVDRLSYALDVQYLSFNGQRPNNELEETGITLTLKEQFTAADGIYAQVGYLDRSHGDLIQRYYQTNADQGLIVTEKLDPTLYLGYHHEWSPGNHTLFLASHLRNEVTVNDSPAGVLFLQQSGGSIINIRPAIFESSNFRSDFVLNSFELQQIWESEEQGLIFGARYQKGSSDNNSTLTPLLPSDSITQSVTPDLQRVNGYAYYQLRPVSSLRLTAGFDYEDLTYPQNADRPPLSNGEEHRSLFSPKASLEYAPWRGGNFRAAYSRSLGGLYFDNSVRLEPTQLAGFTTAFRSIIPEAVVDLVPGTQFETVGVGFDQTLPHGTYFGVQGEFLNSNGTQWFGALSNSTAVPFPDTATVTPRTLDFTEETLSLYVNQLLGKYVSLGANYSLSQAELEQQLTEVPASAPGLAFFPQDTRAVLGHLQLSAIFNHQTGIFLQWKTDYFHQSNYGYTPDLPGESFWQHSIFLGYRFPYRRAELRLGILNLTDQDYHLNPLNLQNDLPRSRTFTASLRLNF